MESSNPYASPAAEVAIPATTVELEPPQSVEYQLSEEDYLVLANRVNESFPAMRRFIKRRQRVCVVWAVISATVAIPLFLLDSEAYILAIILCVVALRMTFAAIRLPSAARRNWKSIYDDFLSRDASYLLDQREKATLFAGGLQVEDHDGYYYRYWNSISQVERIESMLLIYVNPSQAIGIPSRAFLNESSFDAFCRLAERLWQEAQAEPQAAAD